jgi:hypothetical protein
MLTTTRMASSQARRRPAAPPSNSIVTTWPATTSQDAQFRTCAVAAQAGLEEDSRSRAGTTQRVATATGSVARR